MISFSDLKVTIEKDCPDALRPLIEEKSLAYQRMVGQQFPYSSTQTITMGYDLPDVRRQNTDPRSPEHWRAENELVRNNGYAFTDLEKWVNGLGDGRAAPHGDEGGTIMYDPTGQKPAYRRVSAVECIDAAISEGHFSRYPDYIQEALPTEALQPLDADLDEPELPEDDAPSP
ncbi:hypothetical protein AD930_06800 [Acetobacter malorum]|nr:hypothetical protein AD930_06800 [Acetobacter malorum]